jgi:hypothetical protein
MKPPKPTDIDSLSPERKRIARIFYTYIKRVIGELGQGYEVTLQGKFDKTPISIEIQVATNTQEIP